MEHEGQVRCDMCYAPHVEWNAEMKHRAGYEIWKLEICDSCRLLLRNVIGPVLHRMTHTDLVTAIIQMMAKRGITYEDLMKPLLSMRALETQRETIEGVVVDE